MNKENFSLTATTDGMYGKLENGLCIGVMWEEKTMDPSAPDPFGFNAAYERSPWGRMEPKFIAVVEDREGFPALTPYGVVKNVSLATPLEEYPDRFSRIFVAIPLMPDAKPTERADLPKNRGFMDIDATVHGYDPISGRYFFAWRNVTPNKEAV